MMTFGKFFILKRAIREQVFPIWCGKRPETCILANWMSVATLCRPSSEYAKTSQPYQVLKNMFAGCDVETALRG